MVRLRLVQLGGGAPIAGGLAVSGLSTVVMVMLCSRALTAEQLALFMTWWITVTLMVTAFGVFEVYLARAWMAARAASRPTDAVVAQLGGQLLIVVLAIAVVTWLLAVPLARALFDGQVWAAALIPVYGATWALLAVQRGVATGQLRFGLVGGQLAVEGIVRAALVAFVLATAPGARSVCVATVASGAVAALLTATMLRGWVALPRPLSRELPISPLLWLLVGSVGPILIGNVVVPWLAWAMRDEPVALAAFGGAMTLSRIPTQFVSAAFSPMMAALSRSADAHEWAAHDDLLTRALRIAAVLGAAFVVLFVVAGPLMLTLYLGSAYGLPRWILGLLALASAAVFFATVQQSSLAARLQWSSIALAWGVGAVAFVGVLIPPVDPVARAAVAPATAAMVAVLVNAVRLRSLRSPVLTTGR